MPVLSSQLRGLVRPGPGYRSRERRGKDVCLARGAWVRARVACWRTQSTGSRGEKLCGGLSRSSTTITPSLLLPPLPFFPIPLSLSPSLSLSAFSETAPAGAPPACTRCLSNPRERKGSFFSQPHTPLLNPPFSTGFVLNSTPKTHAHAPPPHSLSSLTLSPSPPPFPLPLSQVHLRPTSRPVRLAKLLLLLTSQPSPPFFPPTPRRLPSPLPSGARTTRARGIV